MTEVFIDTSYCIALLSPDDDAHVKAVALTMNPPGRFVTTAWVLTELGNHLAAPHNRRLFLDFVADLRGLPRAVIVQAEPRLFESGLSFYAARPDKGWSLTDCISFVVMQERGITTALTGEPSLRAGGVPGAVAIICCGIGGFPRSIRFPVPHFSPKPSGRLTTQSASPVPRKPTPRRETP